MRGFAPRLAAVVAAGVVVRAVYLFLVYRHPAGINPASDWPFFHHWANLIADGHGFVEPRVFRTSGREVPTALHPPLYPLVLAAVSKLGGTSELAQRAVGLATGAGTIAVVGLLGRRVAGAATGLVAAAIAAVHPLLVAADGSLLSESFYGTLVGLVLVAAYGLRDRPAPWRAALVGALIGLAALTRTEALLLLPLLALPVAWRGGGARGMRVAGALLGCVAALLPWSLRNALTFDRPVFISTNEASVLAGANCDLTYHGEGLGSWRSRCLSHRHYDDEGRQAAFWRRRGLDYAGDHAGRLPVVMAVRFLRLWDLYQPRRSAGSAEGRQIRFEQAGIVLYFLLLPLSGWGAVVLRRRGEPLFILLAPAIAVSIAAVAGWGTTRFRHPAELSIVVLAAVAVTHLAGRTGRDA